MTDKRFQAQMKEVINRNLLVSELIRLGYNAYLPVYDRGVDLIAYRNDGASIVPIQLKGRWMIDKKYIAKNVWMAFPEDGDWYLAPHDDMVRIGEEMGYCATPSWNDGGAYSCPSFSKKLSLARASWRLCSAHSVAIES